MKRGLVERSFSISTGLPTGDHVSLNIVLDALLIITAVSHIMASCYKVIVMQYTLDLVYCGLRTAASLTSEDDSLSGIGSIAAIPSLNFEALLTSIRNTVKQ